MRRPACMAADQRPTCALDELGCRCFGSLWAPCVRWLLNRKHPMAFNKEFTQQQRATIDAAFGIIHEAMIESGEDAIMLTAELNTAPGEKAETLIIHFVRGQAADELVARGFTPMQ